MIYWSEDRKFVEREFIRMGFDKDAKWRISDINKDFELCNTYPRFLILPSSFKDDDLESVAKFRYFKRIPTAVWRHLKNGCFIVRSSQPTVGWFGWFRNDMDESLVQSYVNNTMPLDSERLDDNGTPKQDEYADDNDDLCDQKTLIDSNQGDEKKVIEQQDDEESILPKLKTYNLSQQIQLDQNLQQNNHNNNLQETKKILLAGNGKTIKLDSSADLGNKMISQTSTSTLQSGPTSQSNVTANGNGTPLLDNNIPSVTDASNTLLVTAPTSRMLVIDARSYTAAMANRAKGGGCECAEYYQRCEVQFMNLANIHSIRKSFHAIRSVCEAYSEQSNK